MKKTAREAKGRNIEQKQKLKQQSIETGKSHDDLLPTAGRFFRNLWISCREILADWAWRRENVRGVMVVISDLKNQFLISKVLVVCLKFQIFEMSLDVKVARWKK